MPAEFPDRFPEKNPDDIDADMADRENGASPDPVESFPEKSPDDIDADMADAEKARAEAASAG